jgi:hypothetical protein
MQVNNPYGFVNPFKVWIPATTSDHPLVWKSKCLQTSQRSNSTLVQQTHRDTHALHEKAHS